MGVYKYAKVIWSSIGAARGKEYLTKGFQHAARGRERIWGHGQPLSDFDEFNVIHAIQLILTTCLFLHELTIMKYPWMHNQQSWPLVMEMWL